MGAAPLLLFACSGSAAVEDAGDLARDAGHLPDASSPVLRDAGLADDAGTPDAGPGPLALRFTEVAAEAGITLHQNRNPDLCMWGFVVCDYPSFAGGVAVGDVDGDGWPDVYLTAMDRHGVLYRNRGDGTFEDVTAAVGLDVIETPTNGAAFFDVDRDGDLDLYVTALSIPRVFDRHYFFLQQEDGSFVEDGEERNIGIQSNERRAGTSVAVGDYDLDGHIDLHVNEWYAKDTARAPHTRLLHNLGDGTFEDTTLAAGVQTVRERCWNGETECDIVSFGSLFTDLDGDAWPDLVVIRDYRGSDTFWNDGDGTFTQRVIESGLHTGDNEMGASVGDVDNDGDLDLFVTSIGNSGRWCGSRPCQEGGTGNRLYRNVGGRTFEDATDDAGVRDGGWGWGVALADLDHDGDLDAAQANGFANPETPEVAAWEDDPMRLWMNRGDGTFEDRAADAGMTDTEVGVGLVVLDYDRDGDLDVLMVRNRSTPLLYRNDLPADAGRWLQVRLTGTASNVHGIGSRVRVQAEAGGPWQLREHGTVTAFQGQSELVSHFGFAPDVTRLAVVEVTWPSGAVTRLEDVEVDRALDLTE
jgi:hypothetical protein